MPVRDLKSFLPTAEELLALDLPKLGEILLLHLQSWKDEGKVWQPVGGLNRGYFVQVMEGREQGLGPLRRNQPEYGAKQLEVTRRMLEAWNWLEKEGLLMHNPNQPHSDWFVITTDGVELLARLSRYERWEKLGVDQVKADLDHTGGMRVVGGGPGISQMAWDWVRMKEGQAMLPTGKRADSSNGSSFIADSRIIGVEELKAALDLEYREWMTRITAIFKERDKRIDELRRESFGRANPEGALDLWGRPVRLEALRKAVQSRLELRTEYTRRQPELLSKEALSSLRADLERFVQNAVAGDPRSLAEAGDIIAELGVGIDKLALTSSTPRSVQAVTGLKSPQTCDIFLSHAWEDKAAVARPLYEALVAAGISVWFDEAVLKLGDSLRRKIDDGLARCHYGVIIISPSFLSKEWPQRELDGLVALEVQSGKTKILPIWHEIDKETLLQKSPVLADRVAGKSSEGIAALVQKILAVIR